MVLQAIRQENTWLESFRVFVCKGTDYRVDGYL